MTEEKKGFTVSDRRHFTAEGEVREPEASQGTDSRPPAVQPEAGGDQPPPSPSPSAAADFVEAGSTAPPSGHRFDFAALLVSLAAQAGLLLGDLAAPGEEAPPPDLEGAREVIDLLEDLQRRTQGRRSEHEDRVLQELLYDLRLRFVSRTGRA